VSHTPHRARESNAGALRARYVGPAAILLLVVAYAALWWFARPAPTAVPLGDDDGGSGGYFG
jgi:hypothetical protein